MYSNNKEIKTETIWNEKSKEKVEVIKKLCDLPKGYTDKLCPKCGKKSLVGAVITEMADEEDPNIVCSECGYWFD